MELILVLHNLRSTYNVGAILRSADGFGVKRAICSGTTPCEKNPLYLPHQSEKVARAIEKTALGAMVDVEWSSDIIQTLKTLRQDYQIVGLENNIEKPLVSLKDQTAINQLGDRIVLVLGEEVGGIPKDLYPEIEAFVEIPMVGKKESFNVSVAASIALFALTK